MERSFAVMRLASLKRHRSLLQHHGRRLARASRRLARDPVPRERRALDVPDAIKAGNQPTEHQNNLRTRMSLKPQNAGAIIRTVGRIIFRLPPKGLCERAKPG